MDCPSTQCILLGKPKIKTKQLILFRHFFVSPFHPYCRSILPSQPQPLHSVPRRVLEPHDQVFGLWEHCGTALHCSEASIWFSKVNPDHFMMTQWWGFGKREKNQLAPRFHFTSFAPFASLLRPSQPLPLHPLPRRLLEHLRPSVGALSLAHL